jgi:hypothetical protein
MMIFPILVWIGYFGDSFFTLISYLSSIDTYQVTFVGVLVVYKNDKIISQLWVYVLVCLSVW